MARMTPRRQGDLGELSAIEWLGSKGYIVYLPIGHSPDVDLIADDGDSLVRVQVKTTTAYRKRRWEVSVCTRGGNRSWSGTVKWFTAAIVPAGAVGGGTRLILGGPKYARFEIDPGRPLCSAARP